MKRFSPDWKNVETIEMVTGCSREDAIEYDRYQQIQDYLANHGDVHTALYNLIVMMKDKLYNRIRLDEED